MVSPKVLRRIIAVTLALVATGASYVIDRQRSQAVETEAALRWARQVSTQVDSLALRARERREADPFGWAVGHLTLGSEPRIVRITRLPDAVIRELPAEEIYSLDRSAGQFDYTKVLDAAHAEAVRILLDTGYSGYLGTRFRLTNDGAIAATAAFLWILFTLGLMIRNPFATKLEGDISLEDAPAESIAAPAPAVAATAVEVPVTAAATETPVAAERPATPAPKDTRYEELLLSTSGWNRRTQRGLVELAKGVRDLLIQMSGLTRRNSDARARTAALEAHMREGFKELHESRKALKTAARLSWQSDALFKKAATPENLRMIETALARIKALCEQGDSAVEKIETTLEPWCHEAQSALEGIDSSIEAARELNPAITSTRAALGGFTREFRELESFFPGSDSPIEAPESKGSVWVQDDAVIGVNEVPGHVSPPAPRRRKSRSKRVA